MANTVLPCAHHDIIAGLLKQALIKGRAVLLFLIVPLFLLGVTSAQAEEVTPKLQKGVCEYVASGRNRVDYSINRGWIDVNNDGVDERVGFTISGSSNSLAPIIWLHSGKRALLFGDFESQGGGGKDQRWMRFKGHTFLISYYNYALEYGGNNARRSFPETVWYVTPEFIAQKMCDLKTVKNIKPEKASSEIPNASEICSLSASGNIDSYVNFTPMQKEINFYLSAIGSADVDIDNDETKEKVIQAHYQFTGGSGCSYKYFMLEGEKTIADGISLTEFSKPHHKLKEISGKYIDLERSRFLCNGLYEPRFFAFDDKIFFERKTIKNEAREWNHLFHQVWFFQENKVTPVCQFDIILKTNYELAPLKPFRERTEWEREWGKAIQKEGFIGNVWD